MRGHAHEKLMNKLSAARHRAEEKRAAAEAKRNQQAAKTAQQADYIRQTGRTFERSCPYRAPSKCKLRSVMILPFLNNYGFSSTIHMSYYGDSYLVGILDMVSNACPRECCDYFLYASPFLQIKKGMKLAASGSQFTTLSNADCIEDMNTLPLYSIVILLLGGDYAFEHISAMPFFSSGVFKQCAVIKKR
eukprot:Gb_26161 [translate_table: standard]